MQSYFLLILHTRLYILFFLALCMVMILSRRLRPIATVWGLVV